jgi:hypothetical protein
VLQRSVEPAAQSGRSHSERFVFSLVAIREF